MATTTTTFDLRAELLKKRQLPSDPTLRADVEHVLEHGYAVLPNCFSKAEAAEARAEIERLLGSAPLAGRNRFEGERTNRIYGLLNKSRVFDKFATLDRVLALNDFFLDRNYLISALHTISIQPGERAQALHHDDGFIEIARPRAPLGTAVMLAFSEYTAENGATRVIPGSHLWGADRRGQPGETVPALCPEGGVVFLISTTWHGGGANTTAAAVRHSATVQYCQPYLRPIENQVLAVDPRRLDDIPAPLVDLMGYRIMAPFIGYADGLNPRRAAARMVRWLQNPLDPNPPTFAHDAREYKM